MGRLLLKCKIGLVASLPQIFPKYPVFNDDIAWYQIYLLQKTQITYFIWGEYARKISILDEYDSALAWLMLHWIIYEVLRLMRKYFDYFCLGGAPHSSLSSLKIHAVIRITPRNASPHAQCLWLPHYTPWVCRRSWVFSVTSWHISLASGARAWWAFLTQAFVITLYINTTRHARPAILNLLIPPIRTVISIPLMR